MKFEWEMIKDSNEKTMGEFTKRAKVFGGWLVKCVSWVYETGQSDYQQHSESLVFIPDAEHKWEIVE